MRTVRILDSSNIYSVAYCKMRLICEVTFVKKDTQDDPEPGDVYGYKNVDPTDVFELCFNPSPGRFMQTVFRQKYKGEKLVRAGGQ